MIFGSGAGKLAPISLTIWRFTYMRKNKMNLNLLFGFIMIVLAIVCVIRFFVLLGGGG